MPSEPPPASFERDDEWVYTEEPAPRGHRKGQLRYYLRASWRETREYGLRRGLRRFWVARWFWSAGRIGPVPSMYHRSYWRRDRG